MKCILCYFHNILRYKEKYDSVEPVLKKSQQATVIAEAALAKKEELENKIKILSETQSQLQKEYNNSKEKLDKAEKEQSNLLVKLTTAEKFFELLASYNERLEKYVERLKSG